MRKLFEKFSAHVDTDYSIELTKKLASFEFRVAGTKAQRDAADWIVEEMKKINLQNVTKESFPIDSWGFKSATVDILEPEIIHCEGSTMVPLNGTDPDGVTAEVVFIGDGTKSWYEKVDVKDKIVFMDTNMFGDYWVNVLFEQAQLRGAKGIILTPVGLGPGTATDDICTIQTYNGGMLDIPAVMTTIRDGDRIRELLQEGKTVKATLKVDVEMVYNAEADYVYGMIPGKNPDKYIIINGHFDAYYEGFSDNASSFGTEMAIAKAVMDSGYQPECTWIIMTNGSEETGCQGSRADWLHGVMWTMKNHPEWVENTFVLENIETTTLMDNTKYTVCMENVYQDEIKKVFEDIDLPKETPDGLSIENVGTGADYLITNIEGIPSFMVLNTPVTMAGVTNREVYMNYYHTKIDDYEHADLEAMEYHNHIYGHICLAFDKMLAVPMQFNGVIDFFWEDTDEEELKAIYPDYSQLKSVLDDLSEYGNRIYADIEELNSMKTNMEDRDPQKVQEIYDAAWKESKKLLAANKIIKNKTHKYDNWMIARMGHLQPYSYVTTIDKVVQELNRGKPADAYEAMKYMYTNYLYVFDKEAYDLYAVDIYDENKYEQYWYTGRTLNYPNMWDVINSIEGKINADTGDFSENIMQLQGIRDSQHEVLLETLGIEMDTFKEAIEILKTVDIKSVLKMAKAI